MWMWVLYLSLFNLFISPAFSNKYSKEKNSVEYEKFMALDKPFRMQKLNLIWEKALKIVHFLLKRISAEKLKQLYMDLKFQDKEELNWKAEKAKGLDKTGVKEALVQQSFKAILEKYQLWQDFASLQESVEVSGSSHAKDVFKDKKLNKLWLKAEQQGFSEAELQTLREEFQHHQDKVDQYYQILNQLHKDQGEDDEMNMVEHRLYAEAEKAWKVSNPHQALKEKHAELKAGYDYLNGKILPGLEFEEPQVNGLWQMAKNASFTPEELDSLRGELHHFEHRVKKLKMMRELESEKMEANTLDTKREKRLKDYSYKVDKIHKELSSRILQKHSEL